MRKTTAVAALAGACEFEDASSEAPARDEASTAPFVAMLVCNVILLLMLAA